MAAGTSYQTLMDSTGIEGLSDEDALHRIAELVYSSGDGGHEDGNARALEWADALQARGI